MVHVGSIDIEWDSRLNGTAKLYSLVMNWSYAQVNIFCCSLDVSTLAVIKQLHLSATVSYVVARARERKLGSANFISI